MSVGGSRSRVNSLSIRRWAPTPSAKAMRINGHPEKRDDILGDSRQNNASFLQVIASDSRWVLGGESVPLFLVGPIYWVPPRAIT